MRHGFLLVPVLAVTGLASAFAVSASADDPIATVATIPPAAPRQTPPPAPRGDFTLATANAPSVVNGDTITLTVTFASTGNTDLTASSVRLSYPTELATVVSATVTGGACNAELTCSIGRLAPGDRVDVVILLRAIATGTIGVDISGQGLYGGPVGVRHTARATFAVTPRIADLDVDLAASSSRQTVGRPVKAVAVVTNRGANEAHGAEVAFVVPAALRLAGLTALTPSVHCTRVRCTFDSLAPSGSGRVVLTLIPARAGRRAIGARSTPGDALDPVGKNNTARLVLEPHASA